MTDSKDTEQAEMTIEETFTVLDDMVGQLESDDISLEDSFKIYEKGMKLLKELNGRIDRVEKQMQQIDDEGRTEEFL